MTNLATYSADQIETAMKSAMQAGDMRAVIALLHLLTVKDAHRAGHWVAAVETVGIVRGDGV